MDSKSKSTSQNGEKFVFKSFWFVFTLIQRPKTKIVASQSLGTMINSKILDMLHTQVLSCRTKLEKLLCLKSVGRRSRANSAGCHTTKAVPSTFHDITSSVTGSSTSMQVLSKKGGGLDFLTYSNKPFSHTSSMLQFL